MALPTNVSVSINVAAAVTHTTDTHFPGPVADVA